MPWISKRAKEIARRNKISDARANIAQERLREYEKAANELIEKYPDKFGDRKSNYVDPSNIQADYKSHVLDFYHVPTSNSIAFKAYLTDFKDNYESNWESVEVYGRMDDIQQFKGTKRRIDIGWQVVAASFEEAMSNLAACSELFKMLYPTYESETLKAPPLMKLKFGNLIQDVNISAKGTIAAKTGGLLGVVNGFSLTPNLDAGFFDPGAGILFPKVIDLSCTFTVLHQETPGWKAGKNDWIGDDAWPYAPASMDASVENHAHTPAGKRDEEYEIAADAVVALGARPPDATGSHLTATTASGDNSSLDDAMGKLQRTPQTLDTFGIGSRGTGFGRTNDTPSMGIGNAPGGRPPNALDHAAARRYAAQIDNGSFDGTAAELKTAQNLIQHVISYDERFHSHIELKGKSSIRWSKEKKDWVVGED